MASNVAAAVDLLSVDLDAVKQVASAEVLEAQKASIEALSTEELFAEASKVEEALQKAKAALEKKQQHLGCRPCKGPIALFEGTPIDCGAVAAVAVAAAHSAMSDAALEALVKQTEAELAKAKACLERKKRDPAAAAASSSATRSSSAQQPPQPPRTPLAKKPSLLDVAAEKLTPIVTPIVAKSVELIDTTKESVKASPKATIGAAIAVAAIGVGAALFGVFGKSKR